MSWGGSAPLQTYTRADGVRSGAAICVTARTNGVNDTAELADARENDFATALNLCWHRGGGNQPAANLPMNGYKFTGAAVATARDEFARASQVQDSSLIYGGVAGGTADALTLDLVPSITAYAAGQMFLFKAASDNTSVDVTINVDAVGALNVRKFDGASKPAIGEIQAGGMYLALCDGTSLNILGAVSPNELAFAALSGVADRLPYFTAAATLALATFTAAGRALVDDADATAQRATLGLVIGTNVQAFDALLASIAGLTFGANNFIYGTGSDTAAAGTITAAGRALVDDADATAQRITLGAVMTDAVFPGAIACVIEDQKSSGTVAQTLTAGADRVRELTQITVNRNTAFSLSASQVTIPAGTWEISWTASVAQAVANSNHQTILRNVTDGADVARGNSGFCDTGSSVDIGDMISAGVTVVTLASPKAFSIMHRVTQQCQGGVPASLGTEIYARMIVRTA